MTSQQLTDLLVRLLVILLVAHGVIDQDFIQHFVGV